MPRSRPAAGVGAVGRARGRSPRPGVETSGTPIAARACRSRSIVRRDTANSPASASTVKWGQAGSRMSSSSSRAVRDTTVLLAWQASHFPAGKAKSPAEMMPRIDTIWR